MAAIMGKSREEYEKYMEERLARREKRRAQGLDSDQSESDSEMGKLTTIVGKSREKYEIYMGGEVGTQGEKKSTGFGFRSIRVRQ